MISLTILQQLAIDFCLHSFCLFFFRKLVKNVFTKPRPMLLPFTSRERALTNILAMQYNSHEIYLWFLLQENENKESWTIAISWRIFAQKYDFYGISHSSMLSLILSKACFVCTAPAIISKICSNRLHPMTGIYDGVIVLVIFEFTGEGWALKITSKL